MLTRYRTFSILPVRSDSLAAIVQLAECAAFSGPQLSGVPHRIADAKALISYVFGEIAAAPPAGAAVRAAPPPDCAGFVSDVSSSAPGPCGAASTPVGRAAAPVPSSKSSASFSPRMIRVPFVPKNAS